MGRFTSTSITCSLAAALFAPFGLSAPANVQAIEARQDISNIVTITPSPTFTPEVVKHGPLDEAAIADLVQKLTGTSLKAREPEPQLQTRQFTSTNGAFLSYLHGPNLPGSSPDCPEFLVDGPIQSIEASMGSSNIRGLKLKSIAGVETDVTGDPNEANPAPGVFEFGANERITEFIVKEGSFNQVHGFSFKTDAGNSYQAFSRFLTDPEFDPSGVKDNSIPVGSGIIARIQGTQCNTGIFGSFGIDFLDDLASIQITNITYSGFTNNIAPSGAGSTLSVGSVILDNRNSSIQQSMALTTSDATTKSSSITTTLSWKVGGSVTVKTEASIPFLAKSEVTASTNWEVNPSSSDTELTQTTVTRSATFTLACPARKFCVGAASFTTFKLDVNLEATFSAVTKSGQAYNWVQKGTFKGSDSLAMKLTIDEVDSA
ncbi:hypothetical protein B0O99DRAFT_725837 [Bisporella sp. PMI_857]|nr:hypothetical protein B0O99DRAFT_725837 [Bisporella sp. PMI_857]